MLTSREIIINLKKDEPDVTGKERRMKIDKTNKEIYIKYIANILFVLGSILSAIMISIFLIEIDMGVLKEKDENRKQADTLLSEINERIAKNYCANMLYDYISSENDLWVLQKYNGINMDYRLLMKSGENSKERSSYQIIKQSAGMSESNYNASEFYGYGKGEYVFNVDSLYGAILTEAKSYDNYVYDNYAHKDSESEERKNKESENEKYKNKESENEESGNEEGENEERVYYIMEYTVKSGHNMVPETVNGKPDMFYSAYKLVSKFGFLINHTGIMLATSLLITILSLLVSLCIPAKRDKDNRIVITFVEYIPFGLISLIYVIIIYCGVRFIKQLFTLNNFVNIGIQNRIELYEVVIGLLAFFTLIYMNSIVLRGESGEFLTYTEIPYITEKIRKIRTDIKTSIRESVGENRYVLVKTGIIMACTLILEILLIIWMVLTEGDIDFGISILLFSALKLAELMMVIRIIYEYMRISRSTGIIAEGNLNSKTDISKLRILRGHAIDINRLSDSMKTAVEEQIRSEHMKTELITNVSHDIKTPLTSIINYVDLIKREDEKTPIENEKIKEYIGVLERQSGRLKKLINDLIETSKVSTGNVDINIEKCDLNVLLSQAIGEFTDKAENNHLQIVTGKGLAEKRMIMADAKYLWRAFGNILDNACKYAFPGTRLYIDTESGNDKIETVNETSAEKIMGKVSVIFRNISREPLNISEEELMERFVRGDSSRNTEGSGLGLSIASSLLKLMGGEMRIIIDGDMFKVVMELPECVD